MKRIAPAFIITVFFALFEPIKAAPASPEEYQKFAQSRPELDEISWKDPARGAPLAIRIIHATSQNLTVEKSLNTGLTVREIPLSDLAGISYKFTPAEITLHQKASPSSIPWLKALWLNRQATLRLNGSHVGDTGLVLAKSLRLSAEPAALQEALKILAQIRNQDPSKIRTEKAAAEELTVEFIIAQKAGSILETERMAWKITEGPENPDGMLLASAFLGNRHFAELKNIETENPRWMEDDDVLPVRQRVYQLALDFFLYPSLFHGTYEQEASQGLKNAADVYQFTASYPLVKSTLEDLSALYPESQAAKDTAAQLANLRARLAAGKIDQPEPQPEKEPAPQDSPASSAPPTSEPPQPKRYNLFGE